LAYPPNARPITLLGMAKKRKREPIDELIDAHVWLRRKARKGGERASDVPKSILRHLRRTYGLQALWETSEIRR